MNEEYVYDHLNSIEINSLLKSNRFKWSERRIIKYHKSFLIIKEHIPLIALVGVGSAITEIVSKVMNKDT